MHDSTTVTRIILYMNNIIDALNHTRQPLHNDMDHKTVLQWSKNAEHSES